MRIPKRSVDALRAEAADYFVWGEDLPGFGVRVYASGRKSYLVQHRSYRRSRRRHPRPARRHRACAVHLSMARQVVGGQV